MEEKGLKVVAPERLCGASDITRGNVTAWQVGSSYPILKMWWQAADLIDGYYRNHRSYTTLRDLIDSESVYAETNFRAMS